MITKKKARALTRIAYTFGYICGTDDNPMEEEDWIEEFASALDFEEYQDKAEKLKEKTSRKMQEESWHGNDIWVIIADIYDEIMEEIDDR